MDAASQIRLLIADVDGTLVTQEKVLTDQAVAAVQDLHRAGIRFVVTSGRPPRGMRMLIDALALQCPLAGFNGGAYTHPDLTTIETRSLSPDAARIALDAVLNAGIDAWVYTADEWFARDPDAPHARREASTVQFEATIVPEFTDAHLASVVKIVGISDDHDRIAGAEQAVRQKLGVRVSAARSQPYYLDITHPDANKGAVVTKFSELLAIPPEAIATIGDMPNDMLMFRRSGLSIAMGNAGEDVKAAATKVTDSNENDGFAKAVRRFVLPAS